MSNPTLLGALNPIHGRISLDDVIKTMWQTAEETNSKHKEMSEDGLAINIPVHLLD